MDHTLRENAHGRNREREGNLNLEYGWYIYCRGENIVIFN
jgi:hypothetical protein